MVAKLTWHWPLSMPTMAGAPPLNGTFTIRVLVRYMKSSAAMCVLVAMPLEA
ncbi:hypothetical protein D3C83_268190 [compost metagenome]